MNKNISPAALTHNPKANPEPAEFKLLINTTTDFNWSNGFGWSFNDIT